MKPEARVAAAIDILDRILAEEAAERVLTTWARGHRFAGSGDRAAIRDLVFDALRCRRSFGWLGGDDTGRGLMIGRQIASGDDPRLTFTGDGYAPAPLGVGEGEGPPLSEAPDPVRHDCPDWLWPLLEAALDDTLRPVLSLLQTRAPVFLRVNTARTSRDEARAAIDAEGVPTVPHPLSATALEVTGNARRVQQSAPYLGGLVELQDVASQAVVDRVLPFAKGARVLDYCAGGGGKALALAAGGAAKVDAWDVDAGRMKDLPERAKRAGTRINVLDRVTGLYDVVLADAPCSGSGAWRRQPEAKWRLTPDDLVRLTGMQDEILDKATDHVEAGGLLAYATCSLLGDENEARADAFLSRHSNWHLVDQHRFTPLEGGDGFFIAIFRES